MASPKFDKVKDYYDQKLWTKARVKNAVVKGWITEDEYETITGDLTIENICAACGKSCNEPCELWYSRSEERRVGKEC